jgi:beta-hydroxylase
MKWLVIGAYFLSVPHIHFRGKVRLPLRRQMLNHSTFMAPINVFMLIFSKVRRTPFIPVTDFAELAPLQQNWQVICAEAENLLALKKIKAAEKNEDAGFNALLKNGWQHFYLKWYDAIHPSAQHLCPQTFALLQSIPSVKVATFAELPPGAKLNPHRDPFAGSLRYHLGLATPNNDRCFIEVDGQRFSWRDGQAMIFDETYLHWAINGSDRGRIIMVCDIERPMRFRWTQAVNHLLGRMLMTATSSPDETGDQIGFASKLFGILHYTGHYHRRFKSWSMAAYNVTRIALVVGIAALIYWL